MAAGLLVVLDAFARFAFDGLRTRPRSRPPALVVSGFFRFVRDPMYIAGAALIFGQAVLFARSSVAVYGVVIAVAFDIFVASMRPDTHPPRRPSDSGLSSSTSARA